MTAAEVSAMGKDAIQTIIVVSAPTLIVGLTVGVAVALLQALTQIQEMTLVFIPKIVFMLITLILTLPFMGSKIADFTARIADLIAAPPA